MRGYNHLTDNERRRIESLLERGKGVRDIARALRRSVSTISDEIVRNKVRGRYVRIKANHKAYVRRRNSKIQCMKVAMDKALKEYVRQHLANDQSPEAIAGRLKNVDTHLQRASHKAIYKFVHSPHGRSLERHLYSKAVKKKGGPKRGERKPALDGRIMIDKRPEAVNSREEFGHFEGDFIESGTAGEGSLLVLVERMTRYPFLVYTENKTTEHINALIAATLAGVPVQSITLDNDLSFQKHVELSELVDAIIFFCHPYQSSEKGTVENRNRAIRRYVPKRTDLSTIAIERFKEIESILRNKFMKVLNFRTPQEVWDCELAMVAATIAASKNAPSKSVVLSNASVRLQGFF